MTDADRKTILMLFFDHMYNLVEIKQYFNDRYSLPTIRSVIMQRLATKCMGDKK